MTQAATPKKNLRLFFFIFKQSSIVFGTCVDFFFFCEITVPEFSTLVYIPSWLFVCVCVFLSSFNLLAAPLLFISRVHLSLPFLFQHLLSSAEDEMGPHRSVTEVLEETGDSYDVCSSPLPHSGLHTSCRLCSSTHEPCPRPPVLCSEAGTKLASFHVRT